MENMFIYPKTYFQPSTKVLRKLTIEKKKKLLEICYGMKSQETKNKQKKKELTI